jgi:hypothetical protein
MIKHVKSLFVIAFLFTALLLPTTVRAQVVACDGSGPEDVVEVTVVGAQGTSVFRITCVSHNGHFWTYRVEELPGSKHDLSHWTLGIVTCLDNVVSVSPDDPEVLDDVEIGRDGSTGFTGIKWNVEDFTSGEFTVELDDDYPASLMPIEVLAKASKGDSTGTITGPDCSVTAIELVSFSAVRQGSTVSLQWITAAEIDNAGFNLYRAAGRNAPLVKINEQLIAATGSGSSYSYSDEAGVDDFYYVLEDVDTSGVATRHVPIARSAQSLDRIFLPLVSDGSQ